MKDPEITKEAWLKLLVAELMEREPATNTQLKTLDAWALWTAEQLTK